MMYTGSYHRACMRYAWSIARPEQIRILSAKYGLLQLTDVIEPYNLKMGQTGSITTVEVKKQASANGLLSEDVIALGGHLYTNICREVWPRCLTPLASVGGMGKQIQWLARHRGHLIERTPREKTDQSTTAP